MSILAKQLNVNLPIMEVFFVRSLFGVLVVPILAIIGVTEFRAGNFKMLLIRGLIGGVAGFLFFMSLSLTTVSMATMLNYSYPIFVTIFAIIFLKEKAGKETIIALVAAFVGVFILVKPDRAGLNIGNILAFASAMVAGVSILTMRELRKTDNSYMIYFSFSLFSAIYALPLLAKDMRVPGAGDWIYLLLMCLCSAVGQVVFGYALKYTRAAVGSIVAMSTAVFAAGIGRFALSEYFTVSFVIGSVLVMGSGAYLVWRQSEGEK
jgi:drug/metabolite transporter (DMT)-like permease